MDRHTPVYIRSQRWQCMSEHEPGMKSKELSVEILDRILSRPKSRKGPETLILPSWINAVASIIYKWEKFRTTRTLPSHHSELSDQCTRASVRKWTMNPVRATVVLCGERTFRKDDPCSYPPVRSVWKNGRVGSHSIIKSTWQPTWSWPKGAWKKKENPLV